MRIGILGGGQLGMMMAQEAIKLGYEIISLDPDKNCSITKYSHQHLTYNYNDEIGIKKLVDSCDVITYEFENVNKEVIKELSDKLPQKVSALEISQNRLKEKNLAHSLGIKTPRFQKYIIESDIFYPSIIKSTTGGYDGKGQFLLNKEADFQKDLLNKNREYIIEELINFDYEISVISTRDVLGNIVYYPIPKNVHREGILFTSTAGTDIPLKIKKTAKEYTKRILEKLDYVGTLVVEYFVKGNDVLFNEYAPRPHNSGHYTIEGCNVSQFKNHILAITNRLLVEPKLKKYSIMVNVLGQNLDYCLRAKNLENVYMHDYHKQEVRENRKMGHITITGKSIEECINLKNIIIGEK